MAKIKIKLTQEQKEQIARQSRPRMARGMSGAGVHGSTKYDRNARKKSDRREMYGY